MIEIPYRELLPETLDALIDAFLLREGTDYGEYEFSIEEKRLQVKQQLKSGAVIITFDHETETCNLITAEAFRLSKSRA